MKLIDTHTIFFISYVRVNIKKHLHLVPKIHHEEISKDKVTLHMQKDFESFKRRWQLFNETWSDISEEFVDYFYYTWINVFFSFTVSHDRNT